MNPRTEPLSVLLIVEAFPRISETFIVQLALESRRRGCDITILSLQPGDDTALSVELVESGILDRVICLGLPLGRMNRIVALPAAFWQLLHRRQNPLHFLRIRTYGRSVLSLRGLLAAGRLAEVKPLGELDIIHAHFGPSGLLALQLSDAGFFSGQIVVSFHGRDATAYPRKLGEDVYAPLFRRAACLTATSAFVADRLAALGAPEQTVTRLHSPFDSDSFDFRPRRTSVRSPLRLLTVGRLVPKKGIADSLRGVAALVHDHDVEVAYEIVGDGPLREPLERQALNLGIAEFVTFTGALPPEEVVLAYHRADIFILTSVMTEDGDHEGFGVVLLEAQACGLPVVATRHNGFPDAVKEGESAVLIDERAPAQLTEAILQLRSDPERMSRMGERGHNHVRQFGRDRVGAELLEIYRRVTS